MPNGTCTRPERPFNAPGLVNLLIQAWEEKKKKSPFALKHSRSIYLVSDNLQLDRRKCNGQHVICVYTSAGYAPQREVSRVAVVGHDGKLIY